MRRARGERGPSSVSVCPTVLAAGSAGTPCAGRVDIWGFHVAAAALPFFLLFFIFVALLLIFFIFHFFGVCGWIFCPSWSQKETAAVSLQQKQRGRSFTGAACGAAWPGPHRCHPGPPQPHTAPQPSSALECAAAPAGSSLSYAPRAAIGTVPPMPAQASPRLRRGMSPLHPSEGSACPGLRSG